MTKLTCAAFWKPRRSGLTLVEALAAAAILGTLLVSTLLASGRLAVQSRRAELRGEACRVADELLCLWWPERPGIDHNASGEVPGRAGWQWQTRTVENEAAEMLGAEAVVLEIFAPARPGEAAARVEILLPARE